MILLILVTLILLESMWDGFRTKRDFAIKGPYPDEISYKKYDVIWHYAKIAYIILFAFCTYFMANYAPNLPIWEFLEVSFYFVLLRFGIFSTLFNLWNLDNRQLTYLREDEFFYKQFYKIFWDNTTRWLWYFRLMATIISVVVLLYRFQ